MPLSTYLENVPEGFSEPKKKLLYYLKIMQQAGLEELANVMKVSRMAVHKHLDLLQQRGLVEGIETRGHVGRPRMVYQLTSQSKSVFPKSYGAIATHALDFIERNMGKEGVKKVLYERQGELFDQYYKRLKGLDFNKQVKELARIRDEEGYIAESRSKSDGKHVLLEYNCPIIHIAEKHWEACSTETELFEKLLGANIDTTHRAAKGDLICKFVIKERKEGYL
ncbi:MAG: helix-turn-helix transcriptional regulator [Nitrososphaeraceae archaeon]|jgi:predicted ArsR family transcriptional regulator|nr:helix-turn-helix transcriptional regulator [Nitrososphaeraceae archaeon]MDW0333139.1 helix-turn-helix transcriptional regulator [Nitrososphaeraceae archaeon]